MDLKVIYYIETRIGKEQNDSTKIVHQITFKLFLDSKERGSFYVQKLLENKISIDSIRCEGENYEIVFTKTFFDWPTFKAFGEAEKILKELQEYK